jgi:hypothetical protein
MADFQTAAAGLAAVTRIDRLIAEIIADQQEHR